MPGEPLGHAARSRNHEHVDVAVVLAGKGDVRAVGREGRVGFGAGAAGEAHGGAALARHTPQVARIDEDDVGFAQRGLLQKQRLIGGGYDGRQGEEGEDQAHNSSLIWCI